MSFCRRGKSAWNKTDKICDRKARNLRIPSRQKKEKQYITKETKNSSGIKIKIKKSIKQRGEQEEKRDKGKKRTEDHQDIEKINQSEENQKYIQT